MPAPDTLLVDLGDLGSLTLFSLQADPTRLMLWHPQMDRACAEKRLIAARDHASIIGEDRLIVAEALPPSAPNATEADHLSEAMLLLRAAAAAIQFACTRVLWPGHIGHDPLAIADALERLNAIAFLADPTGARIIDAPILDLSDVEITDLADDSGAPLHTFWPCQHDGDVPCGSCSECARWMSAFDEADVGWPWGHEQVAGTTDSRALYTTGT